MGEQQHRITICTECSRMGGTCRPGYELFKRLRAAIDIASHTLTDAFEISGTACMTGCRHSCTFAYKCTLKDTHLFGDIDPDQDINELLAYAEFLDNAGRTPDTLWTTEQTHVLRRSPAMTLAAHITEVGLS
ncbi:MAG: DUF1636 family protein [Roseobacter sp.]